MSFGFILRNNETGALQYYYASQNNNHLFDVPFQIATAADLQQVRQTFQDTDIMEWIRQQRLNSKWVVDIVTNITFFLTKIRGHPIGCGSDLPDYLRNNRGLIALDCNRQTGNPHNDNLCFFRAPALHNGCHAKNLERDTQYYFQRYRQADPDKKKFCGVTLKELSDLEQLFEVNVFVYSLEITKVDGDEDDNDDYDDDNEVKPEVSAQLLYRSLHRYSSTLYLNLYQNFRISIPGITLTYLFTTLEPRIFFSLFNEKNKDLYTLFKKNMVGGPSIIFHCYHEVGKTKIREHEMNSQGKDPKVCQKIIGYDVNALYLWAIMQDMPTGAFTRRRAETGFKVESSTKMATKWLKWEAHQRGIYIRHEINNTEKRIGERRHPVDSFHGPTQAVFQFNGCYWHGNQCYLNNGKKVNETRKKPMAKLRQNSKYI